jgi:hypothetical protein
MMSARKLLKFLILFDNTNLLYFPGQFLSGRVLVELEDDTPALGNVDFLLSDSTQPAGHRIFSSFFRVTRCFVCSLTGLYPALKQSA